MSEIVLGTEIYLPYRNSQWGGLEKGMSTEPWCHTAGEPANLECRVQRRLIGDAARAGL